MKDLDFDELDRAVNSLMTNLPNTPEPKKTDEQTLTITPTLKDDATPSFSALDKTVADINKPDDATPVVESTPRTRLLSQDYHSPVAAPAARRGRFMDMVRPVAGAKSPELTRPTSRRGITIESKSPIITDVTPPSSMPIPSSAAPQPAIAKETETETIATSVNDWPDPLEMASFKDEPKLLDESKDAQNEELLEATNPLPIESSVTDTPANYTPLTSPFLSDTKVEKRPLGGTVVPEPPTALVNTSNEDEMANEVLSETDTSAQLPANPTDISQPPLPEELSGDLMAIESDTNNATPKDEMQPLQSPVGVLSTEQQKPVVAKQPMPLPSPTLSSTTEEKPVSTGPISIPQQYHEQPNTGDKANGSIYDTDTYHQPLAHPAKKKSGWLWVLWIVIILALGAGGGAALVLMHIV